MYDPRRDDPITVANRLRRDLRETRIEKAMQKHPAKKKSFFHDIHINHMEDPRPPMKILWCDTETTGTDPKQHAIVQFAGIIEVPGKPEKEFNFTLRPMEGDQIEDAALAVTGLTRDEIMAYSDAKEVKKEIETLFGQYVSKFNKADKFIMLAYNARFDADFIRALWDKCGDPYYGSWIHFPPIDVMNLAAHHLAEKRHTLANFKLATVADHFGLKAEGNLHDALTDIKLTRELYRKLSGK